MSNYPKLSELYESIIIDCYNFLVKISSEGTKSSIDVLLEYVKDAPKINQMAYVLFCSVQDLKTFPNYVQSIFDFAKIYITVLYDYFIDQKKDIGTISTINDCCNGYILLFGYKYIFEGVYENEYFEFGSKYYENFDKLLNKYNVLKEVQNHYETTLDMLIKLNNNEISANFFDNFTRCFQKENSGLPKNIIQNNESMETSENGNNGTSQTSNTDIKTNEIGEDENQINVSGVAEAKIEKKNPEIEGLNLTLKSLKEEIILLLKNDFKNELLFLNIENSFNQIMIFEKLILNSTFNLTIINIEKKRNEYLETAINSLKKIIINLANPYNFNLWRKLTNIILKNIFVILHKKKFELFQYDNFSVLKQLNFYKKFIHEEEEKKEEKINKEKSEVIEGDKKELKKGENKDDKKEEKKEEPKRSYYERVKQYEDRCKKQNKDIFSSGTSAADKARNFNIIIVKNNVKYSLSIDFLFYLKEKGNKFDHFDQEIIDLILFDDLNIKFINKKETDKKEEKHNQTETENKILNESQQFSYEGKTSFNGDEILEMLKNPLSFHKQEIDINKIYECVYKKINDIKELDGYIENDKKISDLKKDAKQLDNKIKHLISSYEKYFIENNIDIKSITVTDDLDKEKKEYIQKYNQITEIQKKNNNKIELYEKIEKELTSLDDLKNKSNEQVDKLIKEIKNENIRKGEIIGLTDIFDEFKKELKEKIKEEEEYKSYIEIFNDNNINDFKIEDLYSFLKENLNYCDATFSIIKKDITNFNFFVEVITEFNELKNYIYNDDLDVKI